MHLKASFVVNIMSRTLSMLEKKDHHFEKENPQVYLAIDIPYLTVTILLFSLNFFVAV